MTTRKRIAIVGAGHNALVCVRAVSPKLRRASIIALVQDPCFWGGVALREV